jgi:hypothetical protein
LSAEETGLAWTKTEVKKTEVKELDAPKGEVMEDKFPVDGAAYKSDSEDAKKQEITENAGTKPKPPLSTETAAQKDNQQK